MMNAFGKLLSEIDLSSFHQNKVQELQIGFNTALRLERLTWLDYIIKDGVFFFGKSTVKITFR